MKWDSNRFKLPALTRIAGQLPRKAQRDTYLVGGAVRDLILKRAVVDFDIVTNCRPSRFVSRVARRLHARAAAHPEFFTASLTDPEGRRFDFSRMRREMYPKPAALPLVQPSNMLWDLFRRDFTINAMAVSLGPDDYGRLFDPFGGFADLLGRRVRAMHARSFIDDPTRIFRAARYAGRLGFRIEPVTRALIRQAVRRGFPGLLSGQRIKHELELILREPAWSRILAQLRRLGLLSVSNRALRSLARIQHHKLLYLLAVTRSPLLMKCPRSKAESTIIRGIKDLPKLRKRLAGMPSTSRLCFALNPVPREVAAILAELGPQTIADKVRRFRRIERTMPLLNGRDLIRLGIKPGKIYQQILKRVRSAQLDGKITSRSQAVAMARTVLCH